MAYWIRMPFAMASGVGRGMGVLDGVVVVEWEWAVFFWGVNFGARTLLLWFQWNVSAFVCLLGRRDVDRRLSSAQSALLLQQETLKRADRERCQLVERIDALQRSLAANENDKRLLEVPILKNQECALPPFVIMLKLHWLATRCGATRPVAHVFAQYLFTGWLVGWFRL